MNIIENVIDKASKDNQGSFSYQTLNVSFIKENDSINITVKGIAPEITFSIDAITGEVS